MPLGDQTHKHLLHSRITMPHSDNFAASTITAQISVQRLLSCYQSDVKETVSRLNQREASLQGCSLRKKYQNYCYDTIIK